jgi:hypothetical protein
VSEHLTIERQRSGAHRPRRSPLADVVPALLIVLAVVGVGVGVWQLERSTASSVVGSGGPADANGPGADATAAPTSTASPTLTPSASASPSASSPTDRSVPVRVLNGTGTAGLAGRTATALRALGWTAGTGNARTGTPTTIYYPSADRLASAQTLAADLGGSPVLQQSTRYGDRLTLQLGPDYVPSATASGTASATAGR